MLARLREEQNILENLGNEADVESEEDDLDVESEEDDLQDFSIFEGMTAEQVARFGQPSSQCGPFTLSQEDYQAHYMWLYQAISQHQAICASAAGIIQAAWRAKQSKNNPGGNVVLPRDEALRVD